MKEKKLTIEEICERAKCTEEDIAYAVIHQSKQNQKIASETKKEANLERERIESQFRAMDAENKHLKALIDNHNLSREWGVIEKVLIAERKKQLEVVKTEPPPVKPIEVIKS